jgi:hypothetical protein
MSKQIILSFTNLGIAELTVTLGQDMFLLTTSLVIPTNVPSQENCQTDSLGRATQRISMYEAHVNAGQEMSSRKAKSHLL